MPFDYFLSIDGVAGESTDAQHAGEIAVRTFMWGETRSDSPLSGGRIGRVTTGPLIVTARASAASPPLLLACASAKRFDQAVLTARDRGWL